MITIDGHTFDESLLQGGWIIDAGCRGFELHKQLLPMALHRYYGMDIENLLTSGKENKPPFSASFKHAALTNFNGETECYLFGNGTGNFIKGINGVPGNTDERPVQTITVPTITLQDIYNEIGTDIDLLKLDIEGAEYQVLENIEPIPKQITVEFHQHCHTDLHNAYFDKVFEHLCKHYNATLHIREWPQYKFMDCLFIRKDLL